MRREMWHGCREIIKEGSAVTLIADDPTVRCIRGAGRVSGGDALGGTG